MIDVSVAMESAVALSRMRRESHEAMQDVLAQIEDLRSRHERMFRPGTVASVDANTHTYRHVVGLDEKGNQILSPPRPYSQHAGALKLHNPPAAGQQMLLISPDGDIEQGIGIPYGFSTANPSPSTDGATIAGVFGGISFSLNGSTVTLNGSVVQTGNLTVTGNVAASGGTFEHGGHDVGSTHKHTEVATGGDQSGVPV